MALVNPSQSSPGDTVDATDINTPVNQIAAVVNGNISSENISDNAVTTSKIADASVTEAKMISRASEYLANFVASGGVVAQSAGLIGTFSNIVYYISGIRYTATSVANKTYTASKDTYVDINNSGTVTYTEVANGAASPALTAGNIRVAKVVTSGAAITSVTQAGTDSLGNQVYPMAQLVKSPGDRVWWEEVGRATVTTATASMTVSGLPARTYIRIVVYALATAGLTNVTLKLNNDSGANYARRTSSDGGVDATATASTVLLNAQSPAAGGVGIYTGELTNVAAQEKVGYFVTAVVPTTGAATAPGKGETVTKWVNTSVQINRVDANAISSTFAAGSELIILGHN